MRVQGNFRYCDCEWEQRKQLFVVEILVKVTGTKRRSPHTGKKLLATLSEVYRYDTVLTEVLDLKLVLVQYGVTCRENDN